MKNQILVIIMLGYFTVSLKSQNIGEIWNCNTKIQYTKYFSYSSIDNEIVDENIKIVNIFFHIIRRDDGSGGLTELQINNTVNRLYSDYRQYNIEFNELGRDYINNTIFFNGITDNSYPTLINTNRQNNAINIYLLSPDDSYSRSESIPGKALCIGGFYNGMSVISHETGHCLGLYHTHSGSGCYDDANCEENINQDNCSTCGDLICDTPADPCLSGQVNTSCVYIGGNNYNPDVHNFMSYAPPICLSHFTNGQKKRIHYTLLNNNIFDNTYFAPNLSGPSEICYNQSGTFSINNLPTRATVSWSANGLSPYNGTGTTFTTTPVLYAGAGYVRATVTVGLTVFTLQNDLSLNGYVPIDGPDVAYLSEKKAYFTIGASTVTQWFVNGSSVTPNPLMPNRIVVVFNKYPGDILVSCRVNSSCGIFEASKSLQVIDDLSIESQYRIYPNPATDLLNVSLTKSNDTVENEALLPITFETVEPYSIQLWNERSGLVKTIETDKSTVQIPLHGLPKGMYYVHLISDKKMVKKQILWIK